MTAYKLTRKQLKTLKDYRKNQPRILILDGAKRSGKTFINNILMLSHIANFAHKDLNFIIIGATSGSVWRNVLNDWETMLKTEFKLTKEFTLHNALLKTIWSFQYFR